MSRLLDSIDTPRDLRLLDRRQLPQVAEEIRARFPGLNVLIANAGISRQEDLAGDGWDTAAAEEIVGTNILGTLRTVGAVLPMLKGQPGATIVLKPQDASSAVTYSISVGMSKADLFNVLSEKASVVKPLAEAGEVQQWNYFPGLGMGVLLDGDVTAGVTTVALDGSQLAAGVYVVVVESAGARASRVVTVAR